MIFQKNNDGSHDIRSSENSCVYIKNEMKLNYIDDWLVNLSDLNFIENV